jgi:hypothetical protein
MSANSRVAAALLFLVAAMTALLTSPAVRAQATTKAAAKTGAQAAAKATAPAAVEKFTGTAINMMGGATTATVDFTIERWSTDAQREQLLSHVKQRRESYEANQQLLRVLTSMPRVGAIRSLNRLSWDLRYARQTPTEEGGRRILLATDRPVRFQEQRTQGETLEYPFTIIQIELDKNGRGEGKIQLGTKLYIDKSNNVVLENYAQQPLFFNDIRPLK